MATLEQRLLSLLSDLGTDYKAVKTWMFGSASGNLSQLDTTDKTSLVAAINEVNSPAIVVLDAGQSAPSSPEPNTLYLRRVP